MRAILLYIVITSLAAKAVIAESPIGGALTGQNFILNIVDDEAEWPPYTYYVRSNGKKTKALTGYSIDVISRILSRAGIRYEVELLPWKRALINVKQGKKNQLILNSSYVKERAEKYLYSLPFYTLQHVIFYSAKKYPNGLFLKDNQDLNTNYKICGLRGYSYGSAGVDTSKVNLSFGTYDQLIKVLHDRPEICDLFIEGYEILSGFSVTGNNYLADKDLRHGVIPGLDSKGYHMLISKNLNYSHALKAVIDTGILRLQQNGELTELLNHYGLIPKDSERRK